MVHVRKLSSTACAAKATSLALTVGSGETGLRAAYWERIRGEKYRELVETK